MSVIWSGVTEEGAVVPVQVTDEGKVVAVGDGPQGDYLPITGGTLTGDLKVANSSITADKTIDAGNYPEEGVRLSNAGAVAIQRTGGSTQFAIAVYNPDAGPSQLTFKTLAGGSTFIGGDLSQSGGNVPTGANVSLNEDGSATFAKKVEMGWAKIGPVNPGTGENAIALNTDGSAEFAGDVTTGRGGAGVGNPGVILQSSTGGIFSYATDSTRSFFTGYLNTGVTSNIKADGSAIFSGDVVIGSRGEKWLIRESNGVAMLVQQSRDAAPMPGMETEGVSPMSGVSPMIPEKVRDIPAELDLIEMALNEVMEKLRMTPPAGWPVWDGSDNP